MSKTNGSLVKDGFVFDGWNTQADGNGDDLAPGDTFTISENTTLYAKWAVGVEKLFFGTENEGNDSSLVNSIQWGKFASLYSGNITSLKGYAEYVSGVNNRKVKLALYSHDAVNNAPGTLLSVTEELTVNQNAQWYEIDLPTPYSVTKDTIYWIGQFSDSPGMMMRKTVAGGGRVALEGKTYSGNSFPNPATYSWGLYNDRLQSCNAQGVE